VTDAILGVLQWINNMILGVALEGSTLTGTMRNFMPVLYDYTVLVMRTVVLPVSYTVLALFFVLELHKASIRTDNMGVGSSSLGAEMVFRVMFKMVLCKLAVDSVEIIMNAVYEFSTFITTGVAGIMGGGSITGGGIDTVALEPAINALGFWSGLICLILCFIIFLLSFVAVAIANIIIVVRFFELFVYFSISPIPLATFAHEEMSQIGKNFIKHFAAVCVQGTLIFIVLSFFPILFNSAFLSGSALDVFGALFGVLGYSIVLILAVFQAGK